MHYYDFSNNTSSNAILYANTVQILSALEENQLCEHSQLGTYKQSEHEIYYNKKQEAISRYGSLQMLSLLKPPHPSGNSMSSSEIRILSFHEEELQDDSFFSSYIHAVYGNSYSGSTAGFFS